MAKEEDLKRIELKVYVNCCEGCRKKVLKALSIKGVLRTEIHPDASQVAVVGNVDAKVLLKKLSKVGKTAELILPEAVQKPRPYEEKMTKPDKSNEKKIDGGGGGNSGGGAEKPKPDGRANSDSDKIGGRRNSSNGVGGKKESGLSKSLDHPAMASQARVYCPI